MSQSTKTEFTDYVSANRHEHALSAARSNRQPAVVTNLQMTSASGFFWLTTSTEAASEGNQLPREFPSRNFSRGLSGENVMTTTKDRHQDQHVKFSLGCVVITAHAQDVLNPQEVQSALGRHAIGDWGDVCREDHAVFPEGGSPPSLFPFSRAP